VSTVAFEVRRLTRLAAPLVTAQLAAMTLWVVDVVMVGQVGVEAVGTVSLGRLWLMGTSIVTMGMLLGLDPIASQAHGAGDRRGVVLAGQRGLVTVLLLTPIWVCVCLATGPGLRLLGQEAELAAAAHRYVVVQIPGLPFFFGYVVLRHWLQAQGRMKPVMWASISANLVNLVADWALIYGHLGCPALGATGAGIATAISFVYLFACLAWAAWLLGPESLWRDWRREAFDLPAIRRMLGLGVPVGVQMGLEYWAFGISTLWAGWLGGDQLAAHTIAIAFASWTFMLPLGISFAAVTRVGNLVGARNFAGAQRAAWVALGLGSGVMAVTAVALVAGRWWLPGLINQDAAVIALSATILPIAGAFQVGDGAQVVGSAVLRGMGKTVPAALINLIGFYAVALPLAYWLGFRTGAGLAGIWWGLTLGLTIVATLLALWIHKRGPASLEPKRAERNDT
jgi:MATE family multidrug resistance protein